MKLPGTGHVSPFKRAIKWSSVLHGFLLGALLIWPLLYPLFYREKPPQQITFLDLSVPLPSLPEPDVKETEPEPEPEEEVVIPKPPEPALKPDLKKPEPPKTNVVKKTEIKISTNKVKRAASTPAQKKPNLTPDEIRRLLAAGVAQSGSSSAGSASDMDWYNALVGVALKEPWVPPSGMAANATTLVTIRIARDGTITRRSISKSSGNVLMDDSVMKAVNSVTKIKPLPASYGGSYLDLTVTFVPVE